MTYQIKQREAIPLIQAHKPFRSTSLTGRLARPGRGTGVLPSNEVQRLASDLPTYIVYSYETPIAWWSPNGGWHMPAFSTTQTTNRHRSIVRRAIKE